LTKDALFPYTTLFRSKAGGRDIRGSARSTARATAVCRTSANRATTRLDSVATHRRVCDTPCLTVCHPSRLHTAKPAGVAHRQTRSEEQTSELQSGDNL